MRGKTVPIIPPESVTLLGYMLGKSDGWKCPNCGNSIKVIPNTQLGGWHIGLPQSCVSRDRCLRAVLLTADAVRAIMSQEERKESKN
jgi:hypothetical protein